MNLTNTTVAVPIAAGLILLFLFAQRVRSTDGALGLGPWAAAFGALGLVTLPYGIYVSATWPFPDLPEDPHCCKSMNIIFGETTVWFAMVMFALAGALSVAAVRRGTGAGTDAESVPGTDRLFRALQPVAVLGAFAAATGIPIGIAGIKHGKFAPPPMEWYAFVGEFETYYVSGMFFIIALGGLLMPFALRWRKLLPVAVWSIGVGGVLLTILTYAAIFGHIEMSELPPPAP
jgi:hypothetical protein